MIFADFASFVVVLEVLSRRRSPTSLSRVRWPIEISFARHQFPPDIVRHAVWLYLRFTLSFRDAEDLLAERDPHDALRDAHHWLDELITVPNLNLELLAAREGKTERWIRLNHVARFPLPWLSSKRRSTVDCLVASGSSA